MTLIHVIGKMGLLGEQRNYPFSLPLAVPNQEVYEPLVTILDVYFRSYLPTV